jgi:hypothetical protein
VTSHNISPPAGQLTRLEVIQAAGFDRETIHDHVSMLHTLARAANVDGVLTLCCYGENPHSGRKSSQVQRFRIGDVDLMVDAIMALEAVPHLNIYAPWAIMRHGLVGGERGGLNDIVRTLALVADLDSDTGKSGDLPLDPPYLIESSEGNYQAVYPLSRALPPTEAQPLAAALQAATQSDHGTKDLAHVWRVAGAFNWPNKVKVNRGRHLAPQIVKASRKWAGDLVDPEQLQQALGGYIKRAEQPPPPNAGVSWQLLFNTLPAATKKLITSPPAPDEDRSAVAASVINSLMWRGWDSPQIARVIEDHPQGIGQRYDREKLGADIARLREKFDAKQAPEAQPSRVRLYYFDECADVIKKLWIMKGLIAEGESSSWIGPPGSGKSAALTAISVHVAANRNWRKFKNKRRCGVLYLALERAMLVRRRLAAYGKQGFAGLPIAVREGVVDLMSPGCAALIVEAIKEAEAHLGVKIGLVVIDTFGKGIAAGGGDENSAKDQNRAFANLQQVRDLTGAHTAVIHHTGKDESRGGRGSNAMLGDVDLQVQISVSGKVRTAKATKANDQEDGDLFKFSMRSQTLGMDEDGDPITVSVLEDDEPSPGDQRPEWTPGLLELREALTEALAEAGFDYPIPSGPTVRAAPLDLVRAIFRRKHAAFEDEPGRPYKKADNAFDHRLKEARARRLIGGDRSAGKQFTWLV